MCVEDKICAFKHTEVWDTPTQSDTLAMALNIIMGPIAIF